MKSKKQILLSLIITILLPMSLIAQDGSNSRISKNIPSKDEVITVNNGEPGYNTSELEREHKLAVENGNFEKAKEIESQINSFASKENEFVTLPDNPDVRGVIEKINPNSGDWQGTNSIITGGQTKISSLHKQVDVKFGEDNVLYAAYNGVGFGSLIHGYFYIYKSTNYGLNWSYVYGVGHGNYISNIAMLVESKNNNIADSTRLILFYTVSEYADMSNSYLQYFTLRANASGIYSGDFAYPGPGNTFTHISVVTDGAYWEAATYFGVVATESNYATGITVSTRFFRTVNWGSTWTGSVISTGYNDLFPSADYKEGPADSIYIAVQRKFDATHSEIRVLSAPWNPSASTFSTYYLTNSVNSIYEKPSITIKQKEPAADSILITCTKNGTPVYHFTPNGSGIWNTDFTIAQANGSNKLYTYCSSSGNGSSSFSVCWVSNDGDSINVRRGVLGNLGSIIHKVNSYTSLNFTSPVCATIPITNSNNSVVVYAANPTGVYSTQEGSKTVNIKMIPQGFYSPALNSLSMRDTIRINLRQNTSPYNVVESGKAVFDSLGYNAEFQFTTLSDGLYYISVHHRNFLETWTAAPVSLIITSNNDYNFTIASSTAYGNNLKLVDDSPVRFAAYSGDINQDGSIDLTDIVGIFNESNNFTAGYVVTDLTGDNFTDLSDLTVTYNNSNDFVSVSKP